MRTLFPNLDREDGLETVLEVPIPEEIVSPVKHNKSWQGIKSRLTTTKPQPSDRAAPIFGGRASEIQFLLGVVGAPLIPFPVHTPPVNEDIKGHPIEISMAKYIVQQYVAAVGGEAAMNSIDSMCAIGKVKMSTSEIVAGDDLSLAAGNYPRAAKMKDMKHGPGEMGGFVLWQKRPDLWSFEMMVAGHKMSAGSDGKVAWSQTPWQHSHASRGPPRPLRRSLQGIDPRSSANLFSNSVCIGDKTIIGDDCFVLKMEANASSLRARSSLNVEIIRHTVWGCFSQKTGLLVQLEDSHLLRIRSPGNGNDIFWETTMESHIQDYKTIEGVNVGHSGRTFVSLFRFGENPESHTRTRMEEIWNIEEVDFNIKGLSTDCFLPPADLKREDEGCGVATDGDVMENGGLSCKILANSSSTRVDVGAKSVTKVVAIDEEKLEIFGTEGEL